MQEPSRKSVGEMFTDIAPTYDKLNHILSMGIDRGWRRKMMRSLPPGDSLRVLDVATGTGDVAFELIRQKSVAHVVGVDVSHGMIELAKKKSRDSGVEFALGDAQQLEFPDASFDAVTISFGIRNVEDPDKAFAEFSRVLKPGGRLLILEFSIPKNRLVRLGYLFYLRNILPRVGSFLSGNKEAYRYLNKTIETFDYGKKLADRIDRHGFKTTYRPLTFGIATLYQAERLK